MTGSTLQIDVLSREKNRLSLALKGRLDSITAPQYEKYLADEVKALNDEARIVVDLSQLVYISSMGIRALLTTRKALAKKKGLFQLINAQPQVAKILTTVYFFVQ